MFETTTLENGIRVLTEHIPHMRACSIGILVDAGPRDEVAPRAGLAHLVEHMTFQGTSTRDALQIAKVMDRSGGQMGAFTARDYTCYQATVLDDYVTYALDLFGDVLLNSIYPEESLAREKQAILHEIEMHQDVPDHLMNDELRSMVWGDHPMGRPIAGYRETVEELTREDAIYFTGTHYVPERIIIAAAGNVEHADFAAQVQDHFWRLIGKDHRAAAPRPTYRPGIKLIEKPLNQAYFSLTFPAPNYATADRYEMHLMNSILGSGMSSRLYQRIREERGLAYAIGSEYLAYRDCGLLSIEGSTVPELLPELIGLVLHEIDDLASGNIDDDELWKSHMGLRGQHLLASDSSDTRLSRLLTQELYFGRRISAQEVLESIDSIELNTLRRTSANYFGDVRTKGSLVIVGPNEIQPDNSERWQEMLQVETVAARL